jgi:hypothetical protein
MHSEYDSDHHTVARVQAARLETLRDDRRVTRHPGTSEDVDLAVVR